MDHTTVETKMQVSDKLRRLIGVAEELEAAGVRIVTAEATTTRQDNILVSAHDRDSILVLRGWLRATGSGAELSRNQGNRTSLVWSYLAERDGVSLKGFLTDEEAELWQELEAAE